jgi:hypothetical protein
LPNVVIRRRIAGMSSDTSSEQLRQDVQYLKDRLEIQDCVMRHARGHDRHDVELMTSCFHEDGVDEHGSAVNSGPEYGEWANAAHAAAFKLHAHNITTHTCEIDGDVAYCESYVIGAFLFRDRDRASFAGGRYIDQFERRDGEWKIAVRRTVIDVVIEGDAPWLQWPDSGTFPKGVWTKEDASYQRPVDLSVSGPRWG